MKNLLFIIFIWFVLLYVSFHLGRWYERIQMKQELIQQQLSPLIVTEPISTQSAAQRDYKFKLQEEDGLHEN